MDRQDSLDCFQLDHDFVFNNEVDSVATVELHIFIDDRQLDLLPKVEAVKLQFAAHACLVCRFQKSRAENAMNLNSSRDDISGKRLLGIRSQRGSARQLRHC